MQGSEANINARKMYSLLPLEKNSLEVEGDQKRHAEAQVCAAAFFLHNFRRTIHDKYQRQQIYASRTRLPVDFT